MLDGVVETEAIYAAGGSTLLSAVVARPRGPDGIAAISHYNTITRPSPGQKLEQSGYGGTALNEQLMQLTQSTLI